MSIKNIFGIVLVLFLVSCKKETIRKESVAVIDSVKVKTIINDKKSVALSAEAKTLVKDWEEYQKLDEFIRIFYDVSVENTLLNAKELSVLSQQLKDSIRVEKLDIPSVRVRLHVLYNETLRLADMATIPTIKPEEVIAENENILEAYAAINMKINNMLNKEKLNQGVDAFIDEVKKMDTVKQEKIIKVK